MAEFINISERYGERVPVTVQDYEDLTPDGTFEIVMGEIREYDDDGNFVETVAREVEETDEPTVEEAPISLHIPGLNELNFDELLDSQNALNARTSSAPVAAPEAASEADDDAAQILQFISDHPSKQVNASRLYSSFAEWPTHTVTQVLDMLVDEGKLLRINSAMAVAYALPKTSKPVSAEFAADVQAAATEYAPMLEALASAATPEAASEADAAIMAEINDMSLSAARRDLITPARHDDTDAMKNAAIQQLNALRAENDTLRAQLAAARDLLGIYARAFNRRVKSALDVNARKDTVLYAYNADAITIEDVIKTVQFLNDTK